MPRVFGTPEAPRAEVKKHEFFDTIDFDPLLSFELRLMGSILRVRSWWFLQGGALGM